MAHRPQRRTYLLFAILAAYIVLQSAWWVVLLLRKDKAVAILSLQVEALGGTPATVVDGARAMRMVLGEAVVFLIILLVVLYLTWRSIKRELALARTQRNFLMAVTHELRTPIAAIKLQLQTLVRKALDTEVRNVLIAQAVQEADRLALLTEKVLQATSTEERRLEISIVPVNVMELMRTVVERARMQLAPDHVLLLEGPEHLDVHTDPEAMRTIAENLIENAAKYAPPGTAIMVQVESRREGWRLQVRDEGPGIPGADRDRIFEKFYRAGNEETRRAKGTGLGLYIVRHLAQRLGGAVRVDPASPTGSIFTASFPKS